MTASWSAPKATAPICSGPSRRPAPARRNDKPIAGRRPTCPTRPRTTECACISRKPDRARPLILVHEFAGDLRSYEQQMRHFGKRYRAIAFNARGFPPSDVPEHVSSYSQARAADDILAVLDHFGEPQAHVIGLSMGGFATLHFGLRHPQRALSLCIGGCGYGAELDKRDTFRAEADVIAGIIRSEGMPAFAERYAYGPTRVQYENKDPRGHALLIYGG